MKRLGYFLLIWFILQILVSFLYGAVEIHPFIRTVINVVVFVLAIFVSKVAYEQGWEAGSKAPKDDDSMLSLRPPEDGKGRPTDVE